MPPSIRPSQALYKYGIKGHHVYGTEISWTNGTYHCCVCAMQTPHVFGESPSGYTCYQCVKCTYL